MFRRRPLFPGQMPHERIYIAIREHWIRLVLKLLLWLILASPLIIFNIIVGEKYPSLFNGQIGIIINLAQYVYGLFLLVALFILWILYYLNLHIITNVRIVDIDQIGLLRHVLSELHIDKVEDVTSDTAGVLGNIFNYGNVYIQTAGAMERFEFNNVPNPSNIVKLILDLYEKEDTQSENPKPPV